MKKLTTHEGELENGDVTLPSLDDIPDQGRMHIWLPDLDPQRTYQVMSPRLAHPEQAEDFVHEIIEETPDDSL
jgi:hypothetical protein